MLDAKKFISQLPWPPRSQPRVRMSWDEHEGWRAHLELEEEHGMDTLYATHPSPEGALREALQEWVVDHHLTESDLPKLINRLTN